MATLHYASGDNIDAQGNFTPAQAGFNLADVSSVEQVNALPAGVKGLVWLDQGDGVTQSFIDAVKPYIGNPNVYGFFLKDEPDPTGQWNTLVTAANLKAESDWIHANVPGAKTFITMMNMGSSDNPSFANTYTPENTHIDLFGIDPYPVRSDSSTVDYSMIDKAVAAAKAAGIPEASIVPVFQTFGGGNWVTDQGGHYVMPTAAQEQQMLDHWASVVPNPAFDYAYAWGSQNGDVALENSQALQNVFLQHNTSTTTDSTPTGSTTPVDTSSSNPTTPVDTSHSGTSTDTTSSSDSSTTPTASQPTTTAPTTDTSGSGHNHHHKADSSQSTDGSTSSGSGGGHHHHGSAANASVSTATDTASSSVTDTASVDTSTAPTTTEPTTTAPTTNAGHSGHNHHHKLDFSQLTDGSTSSGGGHHHHGSAATASVSVAADTASSSVVDTSTAPTTTEPTTTAPATDVGNSGHNHHHRLDFSHLTDGNKSFWGGHHQHASASPAATAAATAATDTASSDVTDATLAPHLDLASLHNNHHVDHHSWHW
ncbi:hypothetical protein SAMN05216374_5059 [Tardiphaga sp. OK246]|uniref:calcium-binding protein n=1 Tax=Tardiphaga sp. OK246 TaxID=1855307 RepID=UPI000B6BFFC8|nr:calcium-binding protein [Tardiphaga sp. OK246]SNT56775.1 hypothetical protein SAMN05216374_5059 [Tardiphaga sp. OK246]